MSLETRLVALVQAIGTDIKALFSGKQNTLVSGTNIKTVNGNSLLGAGNLTLAAGGGGSGDVVGPASSTDNSLALFDGTTGKLIKDSNETAVTGDWDLNIVGSAGDGYRELTNRYVSSDTTKEAFSRIGVYDVGLGPTFEISGGVKADGGDKAANVYSFAYLQPTHHITALSLNANNFTYDDARFYNAGLVYIMDFDGSSKFYISSTDDIVIAHHSVDSPANDDVSQKTARVTFRTNGAIALGAVPWDGLSGQVLTSRGPGLPVEWADAGESIGKISAMARGLAMP